MTISLTDPYTEENPAARKIKTEKKEEDISANLLKKSHRKKIHSQLPALYPFGFAAGSRGFRFIWFLAGFVDCGTGLGDLFSFESVRPDRLPVAMRPACCVPGFQR
jgi:hypothetical protein